MKKKLTTVLLLTMGLLSLLLGGCSKAATTPGQTFEVTRGDLNIVVSADGNLTMPDEFDLRFGTNGQVDEILVEEGDKVKQGALLATLDNSAQVNAIKTALLSIQTAKNTITFGCGTDHLPYNYPDLSVPRIFDEAQKDLNTAVNYFKQGDYKDAGYYLIMTYFDVEVGENLIKSKPNAAELAGAKTNSTYYPDLYEGGLAPESSNDENDKKVVKYLQSYRQKLLDISSGIKVGAYERVASELYAAQQEMLTACQLAKSTITIKDRFVFEFADTQTSVDFLQSSLRALQDLEDYLAQDDAQAIEAAKQLYIAKLNLLVGRDVLENQTLIFESGGSINWKTLQQYNLSLQSAEIALYKAKQDIMKTAIIAPSDGTVVSVDLKKSSVLSAQDYSSKTAIKLVDTSSIRFEGLVDEIDIMKVQPGQKAKITVDAMPNKLFTGTVKFISPFGTKSGNVIKFAVTIELDPYDVELRGGLSATADISIYSTKDVLLVPVSVIVNTPSGPVVAVVNEATGQPEFRKVTLGQQTFQYAEVLSGLKEGDKVQVVNQKGAVNIPITQPRPGASNPMRMLR
jgi:RND family efflux transporter MFP subunit